MKYEGMFYPKAQASFLIASFDTHEFSPKSTLLLWVPRPQLFVGVGVSVLVPYLLRARGLVAVPTWQ